MTDLVAKPIVKNQFWIVTDGNKKVGNIQANQLGYDVQINGTALKFTNTDDLKKTTNITFQNIEVTSSKTTIPYPEYPTFKKVYNSVVDVQKGLHLFTKTKKSKCYHAAGWFVLNLSGSEQIVFCPKYIFIQRYSYKGPFKTQDDAKNMINT
jgi:hypothetical protein